MLLCEGLYRMEMLAPPAALSGDMGLPKEMEVGVGGRSRSWLSWCFCLL